MRGDVRVNYETSPKPLTPKLHNPKGLWFRVRGLGFRGLGFRVAEQLVSLLFEALKPCI